MKSADLDKLCIWLDQKQPGFINYENLVEKLLENKSKELVRNFLDDLRLHTRGGGNLGLFFLEKLSSRNVTVQVLRQIANDLKCSKVVDLLKMDDETLIQKLDINDLKSIARVLNNNSRGITNWEHFAEVFKFSEPEIQQIKNRCIVNDSYSPSKAMFNDLPNYREVKISDVRAAIFERKRLVTLLDNATRKLMSSLNGS